MMKSNRSLPFFLMAAITLIALLASCNLPEQSGPNAPENPTSVIGGETLPAPGITAIIDTPTAAAVTPLFPTAVPTDTVLPATDTPVPPTETSVPPTSTPTPTNTTAVSTATTPLTITRIQMFDGQNGFAEGFPEGGQTGLYRTADGGETYALINPPGGYGAAGKFFALNAQTIWAAPGRSPQAGSTGLDKGYVYRSADGGQTWSSSQPISLATGEVALVETFYPNSIFFLNNSLGWMVISVGHYMNQDVVVILNTTDGGQSWVRQTDKMQASSLGGSAMPCQVLGIVFVDASHGFMAGNCLAVGMDERWKLLESNDSGRTWNPLELGAPASAPAAVTGPDAMCAASGLRFQEPSTLVLDYTCQVYDPGATIPFYYFTYISTNGGSTWAGAEVSSAAFYTATSGTALGPKAASGDRYFYTTTNGGQTWVKGNKVTWSNVQLSFIDAKTGWAVVWRSNTTSGLLEYALVKTTNGDGPWVLIKAKGK